MSVIITQGSFVRTVTLDPLLDAKPRRHITCEPVPVVPYRYVSRAFQKTYKNFNDIHHPRPPTPIRYPCVAGQRPRAPGGARNPFLKKAQKSDTTFRLNARDIRLRIERQTLRDLRTRIPSPPRVTQAALLLDDLKCKALKPRIYNDYLEEPVKKNRTVQVDCPAVVIPEPARQIGLDKATQVETADLGAWDDDVTNLVHVITGKITEQCLLELSHEEELYQLRVHYRHLEESRQTRKSDEHYIEEVETERERNVAAMLTDHEERRKKQKDLLERVGATVTGEAFVRDLLPAVLEQLYSQGMFPDDLVEEIKDAFTKELTQQVCRELSGPEQDILMTLIKGEVQARYDVYTHPETNIRDFDPLYVPPGVEDENTREVVQLLGKTVMFGSSVEFISLMDY